ncbi:6956_t:CDS:2 [Dentiscutata erythropus]|uniref:6956_t:CDS:1 n=1 Tax=Dentiscutata erythropus TaxID=1348616 RepID=A0A9N9DTC5_9GLOM|nr:6956_t:CDS:2 [Dentiscutata erythropus]
MSSKELTTYILEDDTELSAFFQVIFEILGYIFLEIYDFLRF